jgi:hypothetical protein
VSSRWSQEHHSTRHCDDHGKHTQEHWVDGLKIQNTKVPRVDLEQLGGINLLLQEQAVERSRAGGDQQRKSGYWNQPTVNLACSP